MKVSTVWLRDFFSVKSTAKVILSHQKVFIKNSISDPIEGLAADKYLGFFKNAEEA